MNHLYREVVLLSEVISIYSPRHETECFPLLMTVTLRWGSIELKSGIISNKSSKGKHLVPCFHIMLDHYYLAQWRIMAESVWE